MTTPYPDEKKAGNEEAGYGVSDPQDPDAAAPEYLISALVQEG